MTTVPDDPSRCCPILHAIGYSTSCQKHIHALRGTESLARLSRLVANGYANFYSSELSVTAMAAEAIARTLKRSALSAADVDAVIFCTESFWDVKKQPQHSLDELRQSFFDMVLVPLRLERACIYAHWISACSNLSSGLSLARSLVIAGQHKNIIVAFSDRQPPCRSRIIGDGLGVLSDVSTSFLVGKSAAQGYLLRHVVMGSTMSQAQMNSGLSALLAAHQLQQAGREFRLLIEDVTGEIVTDCEIVLPDNIHDAVVQIVCDGLGFRREQVLFPSKSEFAHAFCSDTLLALDKLQQLGRLKAGQRVALVNVGPRALGVIMLQVI